MPDFGTARCDFPGGSADDLHRSVQRILALPDATRIFVGHDYKAPVREEFAWKTTVAARRALNVHVGGGRPAAEFVELRQTRNANLLMSKLIVSSLQINMRGCKLPPADDSGKVMLKLPTNKL